MKTYLFYIFLLITAFLIVQPLSNDSYLLLRYASEPGGWKPHFDSLRMAPRGTLVGTSYTSLVLSVISTFLGVSVETSGFLFVMVLSWFVLMLFFRIVFLLTKSETYSFLGTMLLAFFPLFNKFLYLNTRLIELVMLLLILYLTLSLFVVKKPFIRYLTINSLFILFFAFLKKRPILNNITKYNMLTSYGVSELQLFCGIPIRAWFYITPALLITILFFLSFFKQKKTSLLTKTIMIILLLFFIPTTILQKNSMNQDFLEQTSTFLNTLPKNNSILIDYWPNAYYWQYKTRIPTIIDGGTFDWPETNQIASLYMNNASGSLSNLTVLLKGHNLSNVFIIENNDFTGWLYLLERQSNTKYSSESILYKMHNGIYMTEYIHLNRYVWEYKQTNLA